VLATQMSYEILSKKANPDLTESVELTLVLQETQGIEEEVK
jgi:hypothetical protein